LNKEVVTKIYIKDFEDINKNIILGSFKKIYITNGNKKNKFKSFIF
jgi:hypothetical protein